MPTEGCSGCEGSGGGREIDAGLAAAGIPKQQVDGLRVTDAPTLGVVVSVVAGAINEILSICKEHNVVCGHPHVEADNVDEVVAAGFRWLMPRPARSNAVLDKALKLSGR